MQLHELASVDLRALQNLHLADEAARQRVHTLRLLLNLLANGLRDPAQRENTSGTEAK